MKAWITHFSGRQGTKTGSKNCVWTQIQPNVIQSFVNIITKFVESCTFGQNTKELNVMVFKRDPEGITALDHSRGPKWKKEVMEKKKWDSNHLESAEKVKSL